MLTIAGTYQIKLGSRRTARVPRWRCWGRLVVRRRNGPSWTGPSPTRRPSAGSGGRRTDRHGGHHRVEGPDEGADAAGGVRFIGPVQLLQPGGSEGATPGRHRAPGPAPADPDGGSVTRRVAGLPWGPAAEGRGAPPQARVAGRPDVTTAGPSARLSNRSTSAGDFRLAPPAEPPALACRRPRARPGRRATNWPCYRVAREGAKGQAGEACCPPLDLLK